MLGLLLSQVIPSLLTLKVVLNLLRFSLPSISAMLSGVETVLFCTVYCVYIIVSH